MKDFNAKLDQLNQRVDLIAARGDAFAREQKTCNAPAAAAQAPAAQGRK